MTKAQTTNALPPIPARSRPLFVSAPYHGVIEALKAAHTAAESFARDVLGCHPSEVREGTGLAQIHSLVSTAQDMLDRDGKPSHFYVFAQKGLFLETYSAPTNQHIDRLRRDPEVTAVLEVSILSNGSRRFTEWTVGL